MTDLMILAGLFLVAVLLSIFAIVLYKKYRKIERKPQDHQESRLMPIMLFGLASASCALWLYFMVLVGLHIYLTTN